MKDRHTIQTVALLHPKFIPFITGFINDVEAAFNLVVRVVQGGRTFAQQDALYQQGRTEPGPIVTYSPAGTSYHNYWIAADCAPLTSDGKAINWKYDFKVWRPFAITHGLQCGMDFPHPDYDHFENKFGMNWRDFLHKYTVKDFIPGTGFINI